MRSATSGATHLLAKFNLQVNESKTEEYSVPDCEQPNASGSWKKCKLLGSYLDTKEDITRRKALALHSLSENKQIFKIK